MLFRKFASDVATRYRMPSITLDAAARNMLEHYSWRGNIRQLKNVAEQISAIESERNITPQILERYLTPEQGMSMPSVAGASSFDDMNTERELLYKVLFEMRADINEVKQILYRMGGYNAMQHVQPMGSEAHHHEVAALLPHASTGEVEYAEEIVDEEPQPATKADMQKEQILRALRRHNGSRRAAAAELFMSERTLYRRIKELGIEE
jgi:DNA-binding NtrC family response regulator